MKELKDLPEKERILISLQCEPLFLVSKPNRVFNNIFDTLSEGLTDKYDKEVWLFITALVKAIKYRNNGTRFSLRRPDYVSANKIHNQGLSLDRTKEVLLLLEEQGFIDIYKGFYFSKKNSMSTCVMFNDRLLDMIDPSLAEKYGLKRDSNEYLEIKAIDNNNTKLSLKGFRGSGILVKFMERYNNFLSKHTIQVLDEETNKYVKCITIFKRVFSGGLSGAGRFYSIGKFQTLKSHLRRTFLIDGFPCTELDYSTIQPRFIYTRNGIKLPDEWDAYDIPTLRHICSGSDKDFRDFMKAVYLCVLFSTDKDQAIKGIQAKANKRKDINLSNNIACAYVMQEVLSFNKEISHEFFKERLWADLQNMDSRLTEFIIKAFLDKDEVCLGWHDSYVVRAECKDFLQETMEEAWRSLFSVDMNCKIKQEF